LIEGAPLLADFARSGDFDGPYPSPGGGPVESSGSREFAF